MTNNVDKCGGGKCMQRVDGRDAHVVRDSVRERSQIADGVLVPSATSNVLGVAHLADISGAASPSVDNVCAAEYPYTKKFKFEYSSVPQTPVPGTTNPAGVQSPQGPIIYPPMAAPDPCPASSPANNAAALKAAKAELREILDKAGCDGPCADGQSCVATYSPPNVAQEDTFELGGTVRKCFVTTTLSTKVTCSCQEKKGK